MKDLNYNVYKWLKLLNIKIPKYYVTKRLVSHPDYPSLLSVTSLLSELGIDHAAVQTEKEALREVPCPFLAHVKTDSDDNFVLVDDLNKTLRQSPEFVDQWTGVVVVAEKPEILNTNLPGLHANAAENNFISNSILVISTCLLLAITVYELEQPKFIAVLVVALWGVIVSGSVVLKELGIKTVIGSRFCSTNKTGGCETLTRNQSLWLPLSMKFSDLALSFFIGMVCLLICIAFSHPIFGRSLQQMMFLITFLALPVTIYSLYYQWRVARQWCSLCLIIIGLLWTLTVLISTIHFDWKIDLHYLFTAGCIYLLVAILWSIVRGWLVRLQEQERTNIQVLQFERNFELFCAYLERQKAADITPWKNDLQMGNPEALLQLTIVSNPFCQPCAEAHMIVQHLLHRYSADLGVTIRFAVDGQDPGDKVLEAVDYLLQYIYSHPEIFNKPTAVGRVLHDWYEKMDLVQFKKQYKATERVNTGVLMSKHEEWSRRNKIMHTPTLFINGRKLMPPYSIQQIPEFIPLLIGRLNDMEEKYEKEATERAAL
ncbi:hypothetical protein C900_03466 [Fulvivirga imtechensis AK7]|uniref:Vitamin K epoxide reductase domain-containing protein n=1 Tax=Fulvivirga imtechensis AK7 TaxID=1237149 RepID=L8JR74_9BACT|nr:thioredoxin domain-containing protein [Fulvivirga imtechensis]ELR70693.1 hypothetical protein C900_03466 [Fulvivirga imtechensis AK7]